MLDRPAGALQFFSNKTDRRLLRGLAWAVAIEIGAAACAMLAAAAITLAVHYAEVAL